MEHPPNPDTSALLKQLQDEPLAWHSGNRLVLFAHGHWLFVTLQRSGWKDEPWWIGSLNFMREERVAQTVEGILPNGRLRPYTDISPLLTAEIAAKVLPTAEEYRPWLASGQMTLVSGFTTDTLQVIEAELDTKIERLTRMMARGGAGPYVNFIQAGNPSTP